jgi:hypothetical protein
VTEDDIVNFVRQLAGVEVTVASEESGAPEVAWGDVFFSVPGRPQPFATLVKRDYPGVDEESQLDRPGFFRVNIGVGRDQLHQLLADEGETDPMTADRFFPHPVYASYGWVSVINPQATSEVLRELLLSAYHRATRGAPATDPPDQTTGTAPA